MLGILQKRGYLSLVATQFFGAANDNVLKQVLTFMVVSGLWQGQLGKGGQGVIGLAFTVPFIVLSGFAGRVADRYSKRTVMVWLKAIEIPVSIVAMIGFWAGDLWTTFSALVLLTCQSAFFGPVKYGMIPELVDDEDLSRANGVINMMTNVAVIGGSLAAGFVADEYYPMQGAVPLGGGIAWLPGVVMIVLAVAGIISAVVMTPLEPGDRDLPYVWNPFATYVEAIADMRKTPLLNVTLAWGYFYFLGSLVLLIVPEYVTVLSIDMSKAALLLGAMAIGIGVGSVAAGFISGDRIRLELVPLGGIGLAFFFALLGTLTPVYWQIMVLIGMAGFCAGFYIIPLQAMLQHLSPADERGRFLGTANAISFGFIALASAFYWLIRGLFQDQPNRIFLVSAALMSIGLIYYFVMIRPHQRDATGPAA